MSGIPRKGSRRLEVDGKGFRYLVKERVQSFFPSEWELSVTVQEDTPRPGRPMQFTWPHGHEVRPSDVTVTVRDAIKAGWDPSDRGGVYRFGSSRAPCMDDE